ncbi:MAG: hypothetical protein M3443_20215 [Actinomycetota bacterium]|nr:hypothetical protein [Actinomycetota bacterium]
MLERLRRLKARRRAAVDWARMAAEISRAKQQRVEAVATGGQEATVERLEALLFRHDPIGINFGDNTDEYRAEAETIALRRGEVSSVQDVQRVVHEEFVRWFSADIAGPPDRYGAIAREIWNLITVDDV